MKLQLHYTPITFLKLGEVIVLFIYVPINFLTFPGHIKFYHGSMICLKSWFLEIL